MRVDVKLYAALQKYAPEDTDVGETFSVEFDGNKVHELIETLGIEEEHASIVVVNGVQTSSLDQILESDDLVVIFPPVGGGRGRANSYLQQIHITRYTGSP